MNPANVKDLKVPLSPVRPLAARPPNARAEDVAEMKEIWEAVRRNQENTELAIRELEAHKIECKFAAQRVAEYQKWTLWMIGALCFVEMFGGPGAIKLLGKLLGVG